MFQQNPNAGFRGNFNLKTSNAVEYITKEESEFRENEIIKCGLQPSYFAETYFVILTLDHGKQLIKLYPKQKELIMSMFDNDRTIALASRQSGKTTAYTVFALHVCCFQEDKKILICANKEKVAIGFLKRIKLAYEKLPNWLKPGIVVWNQKQIEFSNGCEIQIVATASDAARSFSINYLILDELAFVPSNVVDDFWTSVIPIVSSSKTSKIIVCSTSNGVGNKYHELWTEATLAENSIWVPIRIDWWDVPGRDEEWKRKEIQSYGPGGERKFSQEHGNSFLGTRPTLLDEDLLGKITEWEKSFRIPYATKKLGNDKVGFHEIKIYEKPEPDHAYVLGCDVGEGIGSDYSIVRIFDITDLTAIREVAHFGSNLINGPTFGYVMAKLAIRYNYAYIACERNGVSKSAIDALWAIFEYENIVDIGSNQYATGIFSNHATKSEACFYFRDTIKSGIIKVILRERNSLLELQKFERVKAKSVVTFAASTGHDDDTMALIWGLFVTKPEILEQYYNVTSYGKGQFGQEIPIRCRPDSSSVSDEFFDSLEDFQRKQIEYENSIDNKMKAITGQKKTMDERISVEESTGLTRYESNEDDEMFIVHGSGIDEDELEDW